MKKEKSSGCIIFDPISYDKVIVVYEKNAKFWGFPKGHLEQGETELDAAIREVKEEIGLDVEILDSNYRYPINYYIKEYDVDKTSVFYLAIPKENISLVNQEKEIETSKWVNLVEAYEIVSFQDIKNAYLNGLEGMTSILEKQGKQDLVKTIKQAIDELENKYLAE
jgi:8-oxo-dGTP pyrophosphatase MutT (NUDIX family)